MSGQVHTGYLITRSRWSDVYPFGVCYDRSEKPALSCSKLANLLDRLPIQHCGNNLGARWDLVWSGNALVLRIRDIDRSGGETADKTRRHAIRASHDVIASNKKVVAEVERAIY